MWYNGGGSWRNFNMREHPVYMIKYFESSDFANLGKDGALCFDFKKDDEYGMAKPFVVKDKGMFKMFYSIRYLSKGYRIEYAESNDGKCWIRKDEVVGIDTSSSAWHSGIICYPSILEVHGKTYLFYNGNYLNSISAKGKMSIGYAVLKEE